MGVLVAFAHREGESSGFGLACDVEGGAVFVAPESVVNVVAIEYGVTLCVGLFLVVGFSFGKVVVVNKHVADAERNVFAGLVAGTDRGGPAYGLAHFVFGAEFNAAVYREFLPNDFCKVASLQMPKSSAAAGSAAVTSAPNSRGSLIFIVKGE